MRKPTVQENVDALDFVVVHDFGPPDASDEVCIVVDTQDRCTCCCGIPALRASGSEMLARPLQAQESEPPFTTGREPPETMLAQ